MVKNNYKINNKNLKDVNRCCLIMEDLIKLPFTQKHLFKSAALIDTIRKVH